MALKALDRKGALSLPPSVSEWGKESMLNVLVWGDLPSPQPAPQSEKFSPSICSITRVMWQHGDLHLHLSLSRTLPVHLGGLLYPGTNSGSAHQGKEQEESLTLKKRI